ncbi:MAG: DNA internalization-related competence protein ComEC/Rec2 [Nevskiales bacterium]
MQPARGALTARLSDLRLLSLGLLAGVAGLHLLPELPDWWIYLVGLGVAVVLWPGRWLIAAALIGASWAQLQAETKLADRLPLEQHNQERWVTGWVTSLPERDANKLSFLFAPVEGGPRKIRVSWYETDWPVAAGDCHRLLLRLRAPRGLANPGSFDFEGWLFREGIGATAYVRQRAACPEGTPVVMNPVSDGLLRLRQKIVHGVTHALPDHPMRGVILGLTVGDASAISVEQWQALRRTGTTHLISISGLHVALIAGVVFFGARRLWMLWPRLCLYLPAPKAGVAAAALSAVIYSALAGFSIPTQRSLLMLLVVLGALAWGRRTAPSRVLAFALIAVLLWEPGAVLYPGFWLSFLAVAWIAYLMSARLNRPGRWQLWVWLQLALALALAPPALFGFGETSLVGPLANFILIPLFSIVIPLLLLTLLLWGVAPDWGGAILHWDALALDGIWRGVEWAASLPHAYWTLAQPSLWTSLAASLGLLWLLAPRGWPVRPAGILLCVPLLLPPVAPVAAGSFQLTLLDVGQGLAAVIRTREHVLLYDTGPGGEQGLDAGDAVVIPFLRSVGVKKLDTLLLSHGDLDHSGGLASVRKHIFIAQEIGTSTGADCHRGQSWEWDGVRFEILHPQADALWRDNNASCVLKVSAGEHSVLLPGDIERGAEFSLVLAETGRLRSEVLVVPHHGSATSSTDTLLDVVQPKIALIPAGWRNRFKHPRPQVLARFRDRRVPTFISGKTGALSMEFVPELPPASPSAWREQSRRIWRYPPAD